jgi:predicted nucleic acid-binding protein
VSESTEPQTEAFLIDTSVLLRAAVEGSVAAHGWFTTKISESALLVGSRWLATESMRVVVNRELQGEKVDRDTVERYLDEIDLFTLDDEIADQAGAIRQPLRGGDALHLATAMRLARAGATVRVVTHDDQLAAAAIALGFDAIDPVTDDPGRSAVSHP